MDKRQKGDKSLLYGAKGSNGNGRKSKDNGKMDTQHRDTKALGQRPIYCQLRSFIVALLTY